MLFQNLPFLPNLTNTQAEHVPGSPSRRNAGTGRHVSPQPRQDLTGPRARVCFEIHHYKTILYRQRGKWQPSSEGAGEGPAGKA